LSTDHDPLFRFHRWRANLRILDIEVAQGKDPLAMIHNKVAEFTAEADRESVRAMIVDELRRLHEGALARYGLRASEFLRWRERQERS
jgi:hypothetical protein